MWIKNFGLCLSSVCLSQCNDLYIGMVGGIAVELEWDYDEACEMKDVL